MMNKDKKWRVFVSSTDLDLKYARGAIAEKLSELGFETVMFEKGSFVIDSDLNAHESCINSVKTSDIFILILDKRLGSPYLGIEDNPSITQMEYSTALENKIPIIIFVNNRLEQERDFHTNIIKNSNKNISSELLINKLNCAVTSYAESGKLVAFLHSIYQQYSSNFITYFDDLAQLIEGIERRLKALTPTILRILSTTQNTNVKTRATVLGKEYNIGALIKSGFLVKQEFFEGESSKIYDFDLSKFSQTSSLNFNIVLGLPGTGKSIFMSKLFLDLNDHALNQKTIDMPIYFDLRNIHTKEQFSPSGIIIEAFRMFLRKEVYPLLDFNLVNLIFILDGLDEISEHLIKDIVYEKGLQDFSTFKGFLSVRNTFFDIYVRGSKLEQDISSILNLRKWTASEGIYFIRKWLKSEVSRELSNDIKNHAKSNPLDEILTSPIMSSMYAFSIKYLNRIPKQISDRATLYQ
ncbi:MAG: DUF4062 domain-containing protein, partial [Candidatus Lokiarchaeota archaeon]|nr:DUF4062 domain-containing protein [Candidatus Lokiarchaeota archaeon]